MDPNILKRVAMSLVGFLIAITVHEFAHARAALAAGDDTAKRMGRVSLNPIDHLDPLGTIMFIMTAISGFGIAWGKPVPVNPYNFKNPRWDSLKVSLWGPLSNIITACVLTLILKYVILPLAPAYVELAGLCILFNLCLAVFNLLPIPPLDGSKIFSSLLPITQAKVYDRTMGRYGMLVLFALILIRIPGHDSIISMAIGPPIMTAFRVLMGFVAGHGTILT
jgi:Zn-dependent protease